VGQQIGRWTLSVIAAVAVAAGGAALRAQDSLKVQVSGHYYAEPATVDVLVAVEPSKDNRILRVEADGVDFFRASDFALAGETDRKYHTVMFRNIPAGDYVIRAVLLNGQRELATAQTALSVMSK
jgi:hypothetical protein